MFIKSPAFGPGGSIPRKYTCDGLDLSPPLEFGGAPRAAASLVLVVRDPDAPAGTWDHWVVWDIPPESSTIGEGEKPCGIVGRNSWGRNSYGGPCPPRGEHRYVFTIYALDTEMSLPPTAGTRELTRAMTPHVLASAELVGRYARANRRLTHAR